MPLFISLFLLARGWGRRRKGGGRKPNLKKKKSKLMLFVFPFYFIPGFFRPEQEKARRNAKKNPREKCNRKKKVK
jgi:hypothetical protein